MKVTIDKEARDDLDRIRAWICKDRPESADHVVGQILSVIGRLGRVPHLGRKSLEKDTYELLVRSLPYVVVYEVNEALAELTVIGVFHCAQEQRRGN